MAKIPVEQKPATPWWLWILGLLLLGGIIWFAFTALDGDEELDEIAVEDTTEYVAPAEETPTTGTLTSIAGILDVSDLTTLTGRSVQLNDVNVTSLRGDSTFWISAPNTDRKLFVVLENMGESESFVAPPGADGVYHVNEGDTIDLDGTIERLGPNDPDRWSLTQDEVADLRTNQAYLRANAVEFQR